MTHLHYESERQTDNTEALRDSILRTYRGKNIVLLVYSRHEKNTSHELDELEQLIRESESKNMVFLHIDIIHTNSRIGTRLRSKDPESTTQEDSLLSSSCLQTTTAQDKAVQSITNSIRPMEQ